MIVKNREAEEAGRLDMGNADLEESEGSRSISADPVSDAGEVAEDYDENPRMGMSLKTLMINLGIFAGVFALTAIVVFDQASPSQIIRAIGSVKTEFIFAGLGMMCIYFILQSSNIKRLTAVFNIKLTFVQALKYALIGFFFSSVTPASTGGKPMQTFYMYRDGYNVSKSLLALIYEVMNFELVMAIYAVVGFVIENRTLTAGLGNVKYALLVGIGVNILVVVILILSIFSKKAIEGLTRFTVKVVSVFARDKARLAERTIRRISSGYSRCADYIKGNTQVIVKTFITEVFQMFAFFSIPYFVYLGFGLSEYNIFQIVLMEAVAYVSLVFLPVPGAIGASEGVFVMIFRIIFPYGVTTAMVLSRSLSYYLIVIITGIVVILVSRGKGPVFTRSAKHSRRAGG